MSNGFIAAMLMNKSLSAAQQHAFAHYLRKIPYSKQRCEYYSAQGARLQDLQDLC
jgi:hypothetical protein